MGGDKGTRAGRKKEAPVAVRWVVIAKVRGRISFLLLSFHFSSLPPRHEDVCDVKRELGLNPSPPLCLPLAPHLIVSFLLGHIPVYSFKNESMRLSILSS